MLWRGRPRPNQLHRDGGRLRRAHCAILLMLAIVVAACCLRAPITCVGPLADVIQSDLGMSSGATGTVTTVPLLMFAAFSLAFGELGRRRPAGGVMVLGLSLILVGVVCRSLLGTWGLFLGTAVTGIGITAGNVLLPAIIKARFPGRIGHLTGAYTAAMSLMSAVAGAVSVPVGDAIGWRGSLAIWAVLVVAAVLLWLPFRNVEVDDVSGRVPVSDILRSGTTWLLAAYMGLQSLIYYSFVAWLSVIAQSKGLLPAEAGAVNSAFMILGIVGSLAVPALCGDRRDLRPVGTAIGTMYVAGILLLIPQSGTTVLAASMVLCGLCGGASITYVTMMYALRTRNPGDSSTVSGMSQSVGYLIAAVGPVATGAVFDATSSWTGSLLLMAVVAAVLAVIGHEIGRDRDIGTASA